MRHIVLTVIDTDCCKISRAWILNSGKEAAEQIFKIVEHIPSIDAVVLSDMMGSIEKHDFAHSNWNWQCTSDMTLSAVLESK